MRTSTVFHKGRGIRILFLFCGLLPFLWSCGLFDQSEEGLVMTVGSRRVTVNELKRDLAFMSAGLEIPDQQGEQVKDRLIRQLIDHYLILEYGKEHGISVSESELQAALKDLEQGYTKDAFREALLRGYVDFGQWKNRVREQLLLAKIIHRVTEDVPSPGYEEIRGYYETHKDQFNAPKMMKFRQIVTASKEEAESLLVRLKNGEDMEKLARAHSIAPEAENGGEVEWLARENLEESMADALFSLAPGKTSAVVKTPYGYHIFRVLAVRPGGAKELPEVVREIERTLLDRKRDLFFEEWLEQLRSHFQIKVNEELFHSVELSK